MYAEEERETGGLEQAWEPLPSGYRADRDCGATQYFIDGKLDVAGGRWDTDSDFMNSVPR